MLTKQAGVGAAPRQCTPPGTGSGDARGVELEVAVRKELVEAGMVGGT